MDSQTNRSRDGGGGDGELNKPKNGQTDGWTDRQTDIFKL